MTAPRPGRPRVAGTSQRVVEAYLDLVTEQGIPATTMDQVAERAGVAKSTIYRRWPSRDALAIEAHQSLVDTDAPPPDTGSLEGDLRALLSSVLGILGQPREIRVMQASLGEMLTDERLQRVYREQIIEPRVRLVGRVFERAVERGEAPRDLDWRTLAYALLGTGLFRVGVMGEPADPAMLEGMVRWIARSAREG